MCWVLKELNDDIGLKELKRYCCPIVVDIAAIAIMVKTRTRVKRWPGSSGGSRGDAGNKSLRGETSRLGASCTATSPTPSLAHFSKTYCGLDRVHLLLCLT